MTEARRFVLVQEVLTPAGRVMIGLVAAFPLYGAYDLIFRVWLSAPHPDGFMINLMGLIAGWIGLELVFVALFNPVRTVIVDCDRRELIVQTDVARLPSLRRVVPFGVIRQVIVDADTDSEGPGGFHLKVKIAGNPNPRRLAWLASEAEAERTAERLRQVLRAPG